VTTASVCSTLNVSDEGIRRTADSRAAAADLRRYDDQQAGLGAVRHRIRRALRMSELVSLEVQDLSFVDDGLRLRVRRSKTDLEGQRAEIAVRRYPSLYTLYLCIARTRLKIITTSDMACCLLKSKSSKYLGLSFSRPSSVSGCAGCAPQPCNTG
jgi:hypothetical protein